MAASPRSQPAFSLSIHLKRRASCSPSTYTLDFSICPNPHSEAPLGWLDRIEREPGPAGTRCLESPLRVRPGCTTPAICYPSGAVRTVQADPTALAGAPLPPDS